MVEVFPLKGLLYNTDRFEDLSRVIAPPHDVTSVEERRALRLRSRYHFSRLDSPDGTADRYRRAAGSFRAWERDRILVQDREASIYVYEQTYIARKREYTRTGFIGLIKLQPLGQGVLPHEKTLEEGLQDRVSLIAASKANFGVPLLLYPDRARAIDRLLEGETAGRSPRFEFADDDLTRHRLWSVSRPEAIRKVQQEMRRHRCVIADGHHRYNSELRVSEILGKESARFGLMCFANAFNKGTTILPTNRVVSGLSLDMGRILRRARRHFAVEEVGGLEQLVERVRRSPLVDRGMDPQPPVFGFYSNVNSRNYLLRMRTDTPSGDPHPSGAQRSEVSLLHEVIVERVLGITGQQQRRGEHIGYIKGDDETIRRARDRDVQLALFVNPPTVAEVFRVARSGETMPPKATFFFPKVFSGLVVYKMEDG